MSYTSIRGGGWIYRPRRLTRRKRTMRTCLILMVFGLFAVLAMCGAVITRFV